MVAFDVIPRLHEHGPSPEIDVGESTMLVSPNGVMVVVYCIGEQAIILDVFDVGTRQRIIETISREHEVENGHRYVPTPVWVSVGALVLRYRHRDESIKLPTF